jgi:hypothetical protein
MTVRLPQEYYTDGNDSIKKQIQESWQINAQANQTYWREGTLDLRFKAGDQTIWTELYTAYPIFHQKRFNFNRIRRIINMISGYQRRNRKTTTVLPIEGADEETADQFSKVISWVNQSNDLYHTISEAFEGALTTGINLISLWMDYRQDPVNGDLKFNNLSYNGYMIDQYFRKYDLSDANFVWTRKYLSPEQAISLMPERADEIAEMRGGLRDEKFLFMPERFYQRDPRLLTYDEYWYLDTRETTVLVDVATGETLEWKRDKETLEAFRKEYPQIQVQKITKPTVKLAVLINEQVMYDGPNPYGFDRYPFVPVMAYFEPDMPYYQWKIQGIVRGLRDAQFLYNRRRVIELQILESQINSGMKVMEGSLIDDNDAFMSGTGKALFIKKSAPMGMDSVQPMQAPQVPPSMIQLSELLAQELQQISGVNEELLGAADDDKAGILAMLRQGSGLTTLQTLFDNLDRSQKLLGEMEILAIQQNFQSGKIARILGEEPTPQFFNRAFQKYDAVVAEGTLTETQRKASFAILMQMAQAGIAIPPEILLDKAPIPEKKDLLEAINNQQQQQAQAQQQQQQLEMARMQSEINLANARAMADQGLGIERASRIEENKALAIERRAEAIKDLELAALDKAKAAKELQGIDLSQLNIAIDILNKIQAQDIQRARGITEEMAEPVREEPITRR